MPIWKAITIKRAQRQASLDLESTDRMASARQHRTVHTPNPNVAIKVPAPTRNRDPGRWAGRQAFYQPCWISNYKVNFWSFEYSKNSTFKHWIRSFDSNIFVVRVQHRNLKIRNFLKVQRMKWPIILIIKPSYIQSSSTSSTNDWA